MNFSCLSLSKKYLAHTLVFIFLVIFIFPGLVLAQGEGIVPCDGVGEGKCTWTHLIALIQRIINFLLWFAIPVATILFAYAGVLYMTAGDNSGQVSKAHGVFRYTVIGVIIMASAWLLINVITSTLLKQRFYEAGFIR